jgi:hypothetical protein
VVTVIVYRDGVLASDTASWDGEVVTAFVEKIYRTPDGGLLACAGSVDEIELVRQWGHTGFDPIKKPKLDDEIGVLRVCPDGTVIKYWKRLLPVVCSPCPWAIEGAHEEFLTGLLVAGATAEQAVQAAIERCQWAGGTVQVEHIGLRAVAAE